MRQLCDKGLFGPLMAHVRSGTFTLVFFVAASMTAIALYSFGAYSSHLRLIAAFLIGSFFYALAASVRIMIIMMKMIELAAQE
jgi:hypothetical protein